MDQRKKQEGAIGVFDSGIGGLSVAQAIRQDLPQEEILYFADLARLPYGEKTADQIRQFSLEVARFLLARGAKLIVVACSTASSVALETLQQELEVPIVGILNDVLLRQIVAGAPQKKVGVISTTLTAKSGSFRKWIQASYPETEVISQACPLLVDKISAGDLDSPETKRIAADYLEPLVAANVESVVLGCTHFNFIEGLLRDLLPKEIELVAPPRSVADGVRALLESRELLSHRRTPARVTVATSKTDPIFTRFVADLFAIPQAEIILN